MSDEAFKNELAAVWDLPKTASDDSILAALASRVGWLMKHDYERLLSAVYLLDLSEAKFRQATSLATNEETARALAELILEREWQKFESRQRYRRERSTDVSATEVDERKLPPTQSP